MSKIKMSIALIAVNFLFLLPKILFNKVLSRSG